MSLSGFFFGLAFWRRGTYRRLGADLGFLYVECRGCAARVLLRKGLGTTECACLGCGLRHAADTGPVVASAPGRLRLLSIAFLRQGPKVLMGGEVENPNDRPALRGVVTFRLRGGSRDIQLLPNLDIRRSALPEGDLIPPRARQAFCHFLTDEESLDAVRCDFKGLETISTTCELGY